MSTETSVEGSGDPRRGTLKMEHGTVSYIDLRGEPPDVALRDIDRFVLNMERLAIADMSSPRGLVIVAPQPSDALALSLGAHAIMLIVGDPRQPLSFLLDRFKQQLGVVSQAHRPPVAPSGSPGLSKESAKLRAESPYSQKPLSFNQAAHEERMRQLQQPWHEGDGWKSET